MNISRTSFYLFVSFFMITFDSSNIVCAAAEPERKYVFIDTIHPGQIRYSQANVDQKIHNARQRAEKTEGPILAYDQGRSILKLESALPVIVIPSSLSKAFGNKQYILVDGHHDVKSSLALGATTVPMYVKEDLQSSPMNETDFLNYLETKGYTYPYNLAGIKAKIPKQFDELQDDTNRYFAAITARKYENWNTKAEDSTHTSPLFNPEYPLWVKIGKDIPFIEFMISDKLNEWNKKNPKNKLDFTYEMENDSVAMQQLIEKARKILRKNPIAGLKLIKYKTHYKDLNIKKFQSNQ